MNTLIRAEIRKLLTTRTFPLLMVGAVALVLTAVFTAAGQDASEFAKPLHRQQFVFLSTFTRLLVVIVGIRMVTDEYRFGTIVPTFAFSPTRSRVIGAKVAVAAMAGTVMAVVAQAALLGSAQFMFSTSGHDLVIGSDGMQAIGGAVFAGTMWAVVGVAVGSILRNQVVAIVGTFVWLMALEEMIRPVLGDLGGFLPGQAGWALVLVPDNKAVWIAASVMVAYAAVGLVAGSIVTRRRDVT